MENFIKLQDDLYKRGLMELYHHRFQGPGSCPGPPPALAPVSPHTPTPCSPPVDGNCRTVAAQVYVKSIMEKLTRDCVQDERLVRDFVKVKFALIMQLRVLFNWVFRLMGILYKDSTMETQKDIASAYHSRLLAYRRRKIIFDARGFICMKALVIVDDLINHLSSKESILEYLGVVYYFTGRKLLRMAYDYIRWYPNLLVTLSQRVDDRLIDEMRTNQCRISDIIESLDRPLYRSIVQLQQRTLSLRFQELRTRYLEEIEATWACYGDLQPGDIRIFGVLWEWMAGRKLQLTLGLGETAYPFPEQGLDCHHENLHYVKIAFAGSVDMYIRRVGPGEELGYHYFPELGHDMLCIGKKPETTASPINRY